MGKRSRPRRRPASKPRPAPRVTATDARLIRVIRQQLRLRPHLYRHARALVPRRHDDLLALILKPKRRGRPRRPLPPSSVARTVWLCRHYGVHHAAILRTIEHATGVKRAYRWVETQVRRTARLIVTGVVDLKRVLRPFENLASKERERSLLDKLAEATRREML